MGAQVNLDAGDPDRFIGMDGDQAALVGSTSPYLVGVGRSVSSLRVVAANAIVAGQTLIFTGYRSTNNGASYAVIPGATATIVAGNRATGPIAFGPVALGSGDCIVVGVRVTGSDYNAGVTAVLF